MKGNDKTINITDNVKSTYKTKSQIFEKMPEN